MTERLGSAIGGFQDHARAVLVREAIQHARIEKPALRRASILERGELEQDEDVAWIVCAAKDALRGRLFSGPGMVLVEHWPPSVVVANLNAGDDERRDVTPQSER